MGKSPYRKKYKNGNEQQFSLAGSILVTLLMGIDLMPRPFESKTHYMKRILSGRMEYYSYYKLLKRIEKRGLIKIYKDDKITIPELTEAGKLEALFIKAQMPDQQAWDGKWRMILFDIPEEAKDQRKKLRRLLKQNGYLPVQKSVYINPYQLNGQAIEYLQETGLDKYIRIFRVDMADNEKELKKKFGLS